MTAGDEDEPGDRVRDHAAYECHHCPTVQRAPIELFDVVVTFGNGERFKPHTRLVFGADTTSRNIDLPGGARFVRRVDFRYGNLVAGAQAKVERWGR